MSRHLCLLLLGQEDMGYGCPFGLCADAISSLEGTSIAPKAAERAQGEGGLLLEGAVSSHLDSTEVQGGALSAS